MAEYATTPLKNDELVARMSNCKEWPPHNNRGSPFVKHTRSQKTIRVSLLFTPHVYPPYIDSHRL